MLVAVVPVAHTIVAGVALGSLSQPWGTALKTVDPVSCPRLRATSPVTPIHRADAAWARGVEFVGVIAKLLDMVNGLSVLR
jgi:hypothetical protein